MDCRCGQNAGRCDLLNELTLLHILSFIEAWWYLEDI